MRSDVLVIIPAYNEQETIVDVVRGVSSFGYDYVVVNDGSTDDTLEACKKNGINVLDLSQNLGIGGAVQAGHKYAKAHGYSIDVQLDGDGQHDAAYIETLIARIGRGSDLVIGSRFLDGKEGFRSTWLRRIGISWLSFWLRLFTGERITDATSGFRACGPKAIDLFCANYPSDYPEPESIAAALVADLDVREVPVRMRERQGGKSSIAGLSSVYYMIKVSLAIAIASLSGKKRGN